MALRTAEPAASAADAGRRDVAPPDYVVRTVFNDATQEYEEERVPLREAYAQAMQQLEIAQSDRQVAEEKEQLRDVALQRKAWREGVENADRFQRNVTDQFASTLDAAKNTYRLLHAMSIALFVTGLSLFVFAALYSTLADDKAYALVFAGLGAASFVALFIVKPYDDAQNALSDMIQAEMAFMAFFEQIRMWANYPWTAGGLDPEKVDRASRTLHRRTMEAMADFQCYVEHARAGNGTAAGAGIVPGRRR